MKNNRFIRPFITVKNRIENSSRYTQLFFFFLSIVIILIAKCIQFPILTIHAEMFGENGSNFFLHAFQDSFTKNLFITDAGYLPLTQRFITLFLVKGLHIIYFYPFVSQWIAMLFIAVTSSLINFDIFKKLSPSVFIRFIVGISIALISDFELNAYMNFIYYGGIILFLGIIIDKEKLSKPLLFLASIFTALIIMSKGQFVSFIPIYFLLVIWYFRKKLYNSFIYFSTALVAGVIQFSIISSNVPKGDSAPKLFLLPYYLIKSVYYLVLTYRHVFFGYVTKEPVNIFSIGLLIIFFTFAIKTLISKKDKYTLYVFLAGNFIAVCSLFLTILLYSQTNPVVKNLTTTLTHTSNVVTATTKATNEVYDNSQNTKNIFDVKHHANARGLFVSNILIFFVGIFVLLKMFPKERDQIFFLLLIVFTSGAFGQLQAEQMYMEKSTSYSQWEIYYRLLQNKQYCIPVNNYPFLLNKNCNYLLSRKDANSPTPAKQEVNILLASFTSLAKDWNIQAVVLRNKSKQFKTVPYTLFAYGANDELIGEAKLLSPNDYEYLYYLFDKPVSGVKSLSFESSEGKSVIVFPDITVFGTYKNGSYPTIEY